MVWFAQIFITRKEPLPRLKNPDYFIVLLLITQVISLIPANIKIVGVYDIIYNVKHVLIYFYLVNKLKRKHLKWIVIILLSAIMIEGSIASYERLTGNVGIGHSKGNVEDVNFANQYDVPGLEGTIRAEGTTKDAHALGLYLVMLLPVPFVLSLMRYLKPGPKLAFYGALIVGLLALLLTFTRAGWLAFAISSAFALWVIIFSWKRGRTILYIVMVVIVVSLAYPQAYTKVYERFSGAPSEIMSRRYEMAMTGLSVWRHNFLFGCGAGNYVSCMDNSDVTRYEDSGLPVHVLPLFIASEIGVFGLIAYYSIIAVAILRCLKMLKCDDLLIRGLALAILTAFIGYLIDGFSSPLGRELVPYYMLWIYISLSMSFKRMLQEHENEPEPLVQE